MRAIYVASNVDIVSIAKSLWLCSFLSPYLSFTPSLCHLFDFLNAWIHCIFHIYIYLNKMYQHKYAGTRSGQHHHHWHRKHTYTHDQDRRWANIIFSCCCLCKNLSEIYWSLFAFYFLHGSVNMSCMMTKAARRRRLMNFRFSTICLTPQQTQIFFRRFKYSVQHANICWNIIFCFHRPRSSSMSYNRLIWLK